MKKVVIYTTDYCPYCTRAKQLLKNKSIPFEEIQVDADDPKVWEEMYQRSKMKTVPQIFIDGKIIGGFTELSALESQGKLDELLA